MKFPWVYNIENTDTIINTTISLNTPVLYFVLLGMFGCVSGLFILKNWMTQATPLVTVDHPQVFDLFLNRLFSPLSLNNQTISPPIMKKLTNILIDGANHLTKLGVNTASDVSDLASAAIVGGLEVNYGINIESVLNTVDICFTTASDLYLNCDFTWLNACKVSWKGRESVERFRKIPFNYERIKLRAEHSFLYTSGVFELLRAWPTFINRPNTSLRPIDVELHNTIRRTEESLRNVYYRLRNIGMFRIYITQMDIFITTLSDLYRIAAKFLQTRTGARLERGLDVGIRKFISCCRILTNYFRKL